MMLVITNITAKIQPQIKLTVKKNSFISAQVNLYKMPQDTEPFFFMSEQKIKT